MSSGRLTAASSSHFATETSRATGGAGLNVTVTKRPCAAVCCERTGQQLRPFFHWCICPETSMAPGRRLNIGEALVALP